ncbi:transglycosylase SLT domain-containing protein [Roseicyclus mahoneyensis]|uniref:Transglycosylase-like protein with SLT domain n=1 Tax=Roseicyclus mahoneyensis TaxID=164332 RepID=A0A316GH83_9RHOB|nr:transglycosylase SLT domain-containing protein [Roseicyclus mahoneyensis]PWK60416.1 transglycosylase-like protein with SLT domain [Roseicyclus mahoneyensis]
MARAAALLALVAALALPGKAQATAPDCEALAEEAAALHGIPEGVMAAIARTESGGGPRASAWPWTLNMAGDGMYLESQGAALVQLRAVLAEGQRNVDVGCMQINWHWHGEAFDSLEQMIDPAANTDYAARFLVGLWRREGTWDAAVQAYHSADPERGAAYLARVEGNRRTGGGGGALVAAAPAPVAPLAASRAGDGRFVSQAPLVSLSQGSEAVAQDPDLPETPDTRLAALPEGALPDLRAAATPRVAAPIGDTDRLSRIRAEFGAAIPAVTRP